jgi:hypothetical protein
MRAFVLHQKQQKPRACVHICFIWRLMIIQRFLLISKSNSNYKLNSKLALIIKLATSLSASADEIEILMRTAQGARAKMESEGRICLLRSREATSS